MGGCYLMRRKVIVAFLFTGSVTPMEPKSLLIDRTKLQLDVVTRATDIEYCNRLRWKCNEER